MVTANGRIGYQTMVESLRHRATEQPNRETFVFLVDGEDERSTLTYGELDRWARGIAARLQRLASPGDRAVILLPTGLDYIAAFYGCLYAGLVVVPAYPPQPSQDASALGNIFQDSGASIALTMSNLVQPTHDTLGSFVQNVQIVATDQARIDLDGTWREPAVQPDDLAWLQYTSGSTSAPKGVMFSHARILLGMSLITPVLGVTEDSRIVLWLPPHFTIGINWVLLVPLYTGARVTFMAPNTFLDRPFRWLQTISRTHATHSIGPNFAFDLCTRTIEPEERAALDLHTWKVALSGGEATRPDTFDRFGEIFGEVGFRMEAFANAYGMTEALSFAADPTIGRPVIRSFDRGALELNTVVEAAPDNAMERSFIGCGTRLDAVRIAIVDPDTRRECPEGRVGELWVASPAVALGYWNRPEATEETFGARLSNTGEGPFLRTGDLGFFHDGQLFVTGRLKETIIIRGRNLYPQDIERTVEGSHPAIRPECGGAFAVQVGEEEQLAVVYEVDGDADSTAVVAAIRGAIAARHEVQPYGVVLLRPGTVPRTTTGKLQRSGCRQAFLERRLEAVQWSVLGENGGWSRREYVAPRMPTEHALALLWEAVLGVERVGINDDFFELGGDSLLSVQLTARARQQGIALTLQHLLEHRTLAELARVTREPSLIVAEQGIVSGPAPLVPAQQLFFAPESRRLSEDWTTPLVIEMPTPGDPIIMERAVRRLVEHHDALRMRIVETESGRHQVNDAAEHHDIFTFIDGAQLSKEEQLTALETAVAQKAHALNPWLGPMVHAIYLNRDIKRGSLVVLLVHHLVLDAPSGEILADDLRTLYDQLQRDEAGTLPSKTTSLRDWTNRLAEYAQSDEARSDLPYWLNQYSPEVAALPTDYPYTSQDIGHLRMIAVSLPANETALLRTSLAGSGLHLSEAATTAVLKAFETWTGCRSLLLSEVGHGRVPVFADLDVSRTVGWFTTLFPVLLDLGDALDVRAELQAVSAKLRSVPNGGLGYGALRYLSRDPETVAKLAALPTPEVRFNYQGEQVLSPTTLRLSAAIFRGPEGNSDVRRARSHVEIWCNIQSGALHLQFIYHEAVYKPSTIKELSSAAIEALRAIIAENRASELAPART